MKRMILAGLAIAVLSSCRSGLERVSAEGPASSVVGGRVSFPRGSAQLAQIRTAEAQAVESPVDVIAPGKIDIDPNRIARVALPAAGRIAAVEVKPGDLVKQGQPLLRLESLEAEDAISQYYQAESARSQGGAGLAKAQADLERLRDLNQHGAAPMKDVLNAETELARAQAMVAEAKAATQHASRRLSLLGLAPGEFGQHIVVRAPISGRVLEINAIPGEHRNDTSAALITIADLSSVWVTSEVPENQMRWFQAGESVRIELAAYPGEFFSGRVARVADRLNPETRTVQVHTELANPQGRFRPEMFARIQHSRSTRLLPSVPASAIVQSGGRSWVFVERAPGEFERVAVETGEAISDSAPILSGLGAGARVVVDGAILLQRRVGGAS